uniref:NnrS protein n=1 Tax=Candidatus Kentrum sp. TC TaxID=2126339 RepID=A0A451A6V7_9GAMM|nr:MAG: NnrS protein [Candidatus Kentron sp. TC]
MTKRLDIAEPRRIVIPRTLLLILRMSTWHPRLSEAPSIWMLHTAFIWMPLGFLLKGIFGIWEMAFTSTFLHALAAGAMGSMIVALVSNVVFGCSFAQSLGSHPSNLWAVMAFFFVIAAGIVRVFVFLSEMALLRFPEHFGCLVMVCSPSFFYRCCSRNSEPHKTLSNA